ncbi:MAG: beta-galactosidase, partial [Paenibacillaceae bacterium]|nr:beta-galactosidase [Paenibacillaceae bacterium]
IYGRSRGFGTRRHYCVNNRTYHRYTEAIVTQMAARYGNNPHVMGWQIDNEFGIIDTARCYCETCRADFIDWLKERYGSLDAVNEAWGTIFSSQTYTSWEQLHLPVYGVHQMHNPGLVLDFRRFSSDANRKYQKQQIDVIRKLCPGQPITTNEMGKFNQIDYYDLSADLDVCSLDLYPNMKSDPLGRPSYAGAALDLTRGFKRLNFWITEHQSGIPGAPVLHPTPKPGELRRWTYQSVAHGADAIVYFRWRTATFALEEYWHGILQHHGRPNRKYEETKQVGAELARLAPLLAGTAPRAKVAILRCFDSEWVFEIQPHVQDYTYITHLERYYRYFFDRNIPVDLVSPETDLSGYDLVIAPNQIMTQAHAADAMYAYVRGGGKLVLDFRAGAKEWNNRMAESVLPGVFAELLGIAIDDYGVIPDYEPQGLTFAHGVAASGAIGEASYQALTWYDVIELKGAEPLLTYTADYYAGSAAATRHAYGDGFAYYIGTEPDDAALAFLLASIGRDAGVRPLLDGVPEGVEVAARWRGDERVLFVINHTTQSRVVELDEPYLDRLAERPVHGRVELPGNGVLVLTKA